VALGPSYSEHCHTRRGVAVSPPASLLAKGERTLGHLVQYDDQGVDRIPSRLCHRVPEDMSEGALKVWRDFDSRDRRPRLG
jgi:hypothetical protein